MNYNVSANNELSLIVVDSTETLHILHYNTKNVITKENVVHSTFIEDKIFYLDKEGSNIHIIDPSDANSELKSVKVDIEELCSIHYIENKAIAIFSGEFFNLSIFEFGDGENTEDIINFKFTKMTEFEEVFNPSDNMLEETARYNLHNIKNTQFSFMSCSYGESVNVLLKTEQNKWGVESVEEQSIRLLAPTDRTGEICSFKGVVYYPLKFSEKEGDY